jgi:putative ABC transport system permease protein
MHAPRLLRSNPGVTVAALVTLAFGIGANSAIFSLMDAVVLRPLPNPDPDRLMLVHDTENHCGMNASWPMVRDWQDLNRVFEHLAAFQGGANRGARAGRRRGPLITGEVALSPVLPAAARIDPAVTLRCE